MTQEEKDLLIKDLCARLPYGVTLNCCDSIGEKLTSIDENGLVNHDYDIDEVKPHLFPLSSMTEEQEYQYREVIASSLNHYEVYDWLNKNHFDYRGLIEKSLALDATNLGIYE